MADISQEEKERLRDSGAGVFVQAPPPIGLDDLLACFSMRMPYTMGEVVAIFVVLVLITTEFDVPPLAQWDRWILAAAVSTYFTLYLGKSVGRLPHTVRIRVSRN
jgi:hypothetical protein